MVDTKLDDLKKCNPIIDTAIKLDLPVKERSGTQAIRCINPAHEDKHPSMLLMPDVNRYECKSCPARGDVIDLIMGVKKCDFREAISWLDADYFNEESQEKEVNLSFEPEEYLSKIRLLNKETVEKFKIKLKKYDGPVKDHLGDWCVELPIPTGFKYRFIYKSGKERFVHSPGATNCLFKTCEHETGVIITGGEFDAILTWQKTGAACWTQTTGEEKLDEKFIKDFDKFKTIYLATDNDDPGEKAAQLIADQLGRKRCFRVQIPKEFGKDLTDYWKAGKTKDEFIKLLRESPSMEHTLLDRLEKELKDEILKFGSGFKKLDASVGGFRSGNLYILGGLKKCGKSSYLMKQLVYMMNQGIKIGFINTELTFRDFVVRFAAISENLTIQEVEANTDIARSWFKEIEPFLYYCDKEALITEKGLSLNKLQQVLRKWTDAGVKVFVLDNITTFNIEASSTQKGWEFLSKCIALLVDFTRENKILGFAVLHTKPALISSETLDAIKNLIAERNTETIFSKSFPFNRRPTAADLYGGGGALSQVSGGILLLWRPFQDFNDHILQSKTLLILEDFRHGVDISEIKLEFQGEKLQFIET